MRIFLETERLVLRQLTLADADLLVELDSDPDVTRFLLPDDAILPHDLPAILSYYERFDGYGFWAVVEKASGAFLGWFHFRPLKDAPLDEPELGYRLRKAAWGKGYATEVARALIRKGFRELGVRRVVASTAADNIASRRVMEKAGLTLVREYPSPFVDPGSGAAQEDVEYALEKADWEQQVAG